MPRPTHHDTTIPVTGSNPAKTTTIATLIAEKSVFSTLTSGVRRSPVRTLSWRTKMVQPATDTTKPRLIHGLLVTKSNSEDSRGATRRNPSPRAAASPAAAR